jgi:hypothetical protein
MSEDSFLKETAKQLPIKEAYDDLFNPALSEAGKGLQGIVKVALTPVSALVWGYEKIASYLNIAIPEFFSKRKVDAKNIIPPDPAIAVPAIAAMQYTSEKEEIRSIFKNLLCSSMNAETADSVHPAFVEVAKQISVLDAQLLEKINNKRQAIYAYVTINIASSGNIYFDGMPDIFAPDFIDLADPFSVSISLQNLKRLSLIELFNGGLLQTDYSFIKTHPYVLERLNRFKQLSPEEKLEIGINNKYLRITNFGIDFATIAFDALNIRKLLDNPIVTSLI